MALREENLHRLNFRAGTESNGVKVNWSQSAKTTWYRWTGGLGTAAVAGFALSTQAQDPVTPWLQYHLGKVVFLPRAEIANTFTDNLFNQSRRDRESDVITSVTPGLRLKLDENAAVDASMGYRHTETLLWTNSDFNSSSDILDASLSYTAAKWKVSGSAGWSDTVTLPNGMLNIGRNVLRSTTISGSGNVTYDWTAKSDISAALNYRDTANKSIFLLSQGQTDGRLGLSHELTSRLRLTGDVKSGHTTAKSNDGTGRTFGSFFYGGLVGLRGSLTQKLSGSVKVGYEARQFDNGESVNAATPAAGLEVEYQASVLTTVSLGYERTTGIGVFQGGSVTIRDSVNLRGTHFFGITKRWSVTGITRVSLGDYQFGQVLAVPGQAPNSRTDAWTEFDLMFSYRPQAWLTCSAGYSFDKYELNFDQAIIQNLIVANSYVSHRVSLSVALGF